MAITSGSTITFLNGTQSNYNSLVGNYSDTTLYFTDHDKLYLGDRLISSEVEDATYESSVLTITKKDGSTFSLNFSDMASASAIATALATKVDSVTVTQGSEPASGITASISQVTDSGSTKIELDIDVSSLDSTLVSIAEAAGSTINNISAVKDVTITNSTGIGVTTDTTNGTITVSNTGVTSVSSGSTGYLTTSSTNGESTISLNVASGTTSTGYEGMLASTDWVQAACTNGALDVVNSITGSTSGSVATEGAVTITGAGSVTVSSTANGVTVTGTDTTYSNATTSTAGLMSASDKSKLDGIATGAQVNVIESVKQSTNYTGSSAGSVDLLSVGTTGKEVTISSEGLDSVLDEIFTGLSDLDTSSISSFTVTPTTYLTSSTSNGAVTLTASALTTAMDKKLESVTTINDIFSKHPAGETTKLFSTSTSTTNKESVIDATNLVSALDTAYTGLSDHESRIGTLEGFIEADADGTIDKFNEIVAFLAGIGDDNTLQDLIEASTYSAGAGIGISSNVISNTGVISVISGSTGYLTTSSTNGESTISLNVASGTTSTGYEGMLASTDWVQAACTNGALDVVNSITGSTSGSVATEGAVTITGVGSVTVSSTASGVTVTGTDTSVSTAAWTGGTSSGPTLKLTNNDSSTVTTAAIPSASSSASGIVTTGEQTLSGRKIIPDGVAITGGSGDLSLESYSNIEFITDTELGGTYTPIYITADSTGMGKFTAGSACAPQSHASSSTTYGASTSTNYGHVRLSDSITSSTHSTTSGYAATPKAVYDAISAATLVWGTF